MVTAGADGDIHLYRVEVIIAMDDDGAPKIKVQHMQSLYLTGLVTAMAFRKHYILAHARGTVTFSVGDLRQDCTVTKLNLNAACAGPTGGFDEHVSFTVLCLSPDARYVACATDTSRHLILDLESLVWSATCTDIPPMAFQVPSLRSVSMDSISIPIPC
jgi:hypothetical protein